jgi:hypothetical protein
MRLGDSATAVGCRFKQGQKIGHAEKLAEFLAEVDDLQAAAGRSRRNV